MHYRQLKRIARGEKVINLNDIFGICSLIPGMEGRDWSSAIVSFESLTYLNLKRVNWESSWFDYNCKLSKGIIWFQLDLKREECGCVFFAGFDHLKLVNNFLNEKHYSKTISRFTQDVLNEYCEQLCQELKGSGLRTPSKPWVSIFESSHENYSRITNLLSFYLKHYDGNKITKRSTRKH